MNRITGIRGYLHLFALTLVAGAAHYAPDADAHGGRRFGFFIGGAVVGAAVFAPRYVYPAPYYYYPPAPVYYPPTVTYINPPVVVQQMAPIAVQPAVPQAAPQYAAPQSAARAPTLSIEDRLRRLRSVCDQGLLTETECHTRREQILQEM